MFTSNDTVKDSSKTANNPLISVIIPVYKPNLGYFKEAIQSVLSQSYSNWEAIIINDGCKKIEESKIKNFIASLHDKRISIIDLEKNYGVSTARNTGMKVATGNIVTFLDSDDIHLPWHYKEIVEITNKYPQYSIIFSPRIFYYQKWFMKKIHIRSNLIDLETYKHHTDELIEKLKTVTMIPSVFIRKEVLNKVSFDPSIYFAEDLDFSLQILINKELLNKTNFLPTNGHLYRHHLSFDRLSFTSDLVFNSFEFIKNKYLKNDNSFAGKYISHKIDTSNLWKLSAYLNKYNHDGSIFNYIRDTFKESKTMKEKVKSIKALFDTICLTKLPIARIINNIYYLRLILKTNNIELNKFRDLFISEMKSITDIKSKHYAQNILKSLF